ncbi:MAG: Gfo/Idh/MocA family oxidoreductase [Ferruginibacter sp.]
MQSKFSRRSFLTTAGTAAAGTMLASPLISEAAAVFRGPKKRYAMVGTGHRGTGMWGKDVIAAYGDYVEFAGLCDINKGRVETARKMLGLNCPTFTNFEEMMRTVKPDVLIVTTVDATHNEFIVKGMEMGADIITEKPMTTDEAKCQQIIDAEKRTGKKVTVTFNYRYSPHRAKMWELLRSGAIGKITSVDFHWYLDIHHGADYFRRWHRLRENSGSLWVHKASHHFDLLNWWIDSDPTEVFAYGALEHYGKNGKLRGTSCRTCEHKGNCKFYWDMTRDARLMALYADNQQYDGYLRDGCVFREDINIFDKMGASIKYANGVQVSYSLTAYSPYEGYRIAFNGTEGRLEAWIQESNPPAADEKKDYDELMLTKNFGKPELIQVRQPGGGHGGGDKLLKDKIFIPGTPDPLRQSAGVRDGSLSCLIGIAARKSCDSGKPVKIGELTTITPGVQKI